MSVEAKLMGEFLRARRELIAPQDVGLPVVGTRRVRGLRREEVALLAGISADYYLRLEQGRDHRPSAQVLESISGALQLDEAESAYLASLAVDRPRRRRRGRRETVPSGITRLLATLHLPAFVEGRYLDVLAANPLATAISPRMVAGANRLRDVFLDPQERELLMDWEPATRSLVAGFRESVGTEIDDPRCIELVGELSLASPRFRELWARHDIRPLQSGRMHLDHPQVGELRLDHEKLLVPGTQGMRLVILHVDPGPSCPLQSVEDKKGRGPRGG